MIEIQLYIFLNGKHFNTKLSVFFQRDVGESED